MSIHQTYINNDALKRVTADDALKRVTAVGDEGISFKMHVWLTHIHVLLHIYIYRIKLSAEYSLMKQNCLNAYPILVRICRLLSNMSRQHIMLMLVWQYVYIFENNEQKKKHGFDSVFCVVGPWCNHCIQCIVHTGSIHPSKWSSWIKKKQKRGGASKSRFWYFCSFEDYYKDQAFP